MPGSSGCIGFPCWIDTALCVYGGGGGGGGDTGYTRCLAPQGEWTLYG